MLHRLCGPPSIPLSFSLATVLPRRNAYRVNYGTIGLDTDHTKHSSFKARTTRVSNPVCSPSFRASASVVVQRAAFATGVPPDIYAFHRYTGNSTRLSHTPARVSPAGSELSPEVSQETYRTAYAPFTPNNSEQRSPPSYYRGCWHEVSRGFFHRYRHYSSRSKGVYVPRDFIPHAALLCQGFPHCAKFPTAASRRSLDRVSVPVWPCALSGRLLIIALVGRYLTN